MRLDAHPLVVAVAMGLLGPAALENDDDEVPAERARVEAAACCDRGLCSELDTVCGPPDAPPRA